jgi:hypothetical protein
MPPVRVAPQRKRHTTRSTSAVSPWSKKSPKLHPVLLEALTEGFPSERERFISDASALAGLAKPKLTAFLRERGFEPLPSATPALEFRKLVERPDRLAFEQFVTVFPDGVIQLLSYSLRFEDGGFEGIRNYQQLAADIVAIQRKSGRLVADSSLRHEDET